MNKVNDIKDLPKSVQAQASTLIMRPVRMVVIHKPTNQSAMKDVPLSQCRKFFEACVKAHNEALSQKHGVAGMEAPRSEFLAVQIDWEDRSVITSSL